MTPAELRALREAATPGRWLLDPDSPFYDEFSDIEAGQWWIVAAAEHIGATHEGDARLIALAPTLADLVVKMAEALEEARSAFGYIAQTLEMNDRPAAAASHARLHAERSHAALASLA